VKDTLTGLDGRFATTAAAIVAIALGLLTCVGCTAAAPAARPVPAPPPIPSRSLPSPGCSDGSDVGAALARVRTAMTSVPSEPFGVSVTPDGRWAFVAAATGVEVLRSGRSLAPVPVRRIALPGFPAGQALTPDGRYLLVADGSGAVVISVARAERGTAGAVVGTLRVPPGQGDDSAAATSRQAQAAALLDTALEVAVSPDGRFAFVSLEYANVAVVFNLARALTSGFSATDFVGSIPLGESAAGLAVSPDGRWLYATSEVAVPDQPAADLRTATTLSRSQAAACTDTVAGEPPGTLTMISLGQAETDPARSVRATVAAGFQPVRVITSDDGALVWVTARSSDDLLCFSAARLASSPARALVAVVRVGGAPVGLSAVRGGALIVVADSDRFDTRGETANLDVVSVADVLAGRAAVVGHVRSGSFPREMTVQPDNDGILLVTDNASDQLESVMVSSLPTG